MSIITKRIDYMTKGKSGKGKKEKEKSEKGLIADKVTLDQLLSEQVPRNIIKALGGKGRRKEKISSKEIVFTKADESSSVLALEITSDSESEFDSQEPLPKLIGVAPSGTSKSLISLSDLTLNMVDLTLDTLVPKKNRPSVKVSPAYVLKKKTKKSLAGPKLCSDKKDDSSTKKLLLTLMEEVKGLKRQVEIPSGLPQEESGLEVVFRDDSSRDTEGYGSAYYNGITFTRVSYVNGLKHNLISISQLYDANYKVLFTKTQGTIYNQNDEVVLIAPRRKDGSSLGFFSLERLLDEENDATSGLTPLKADLDPHETGQSASLYEDIIGQYNVDTSGVATVEENLPEIIGPPPPYAFLGPKCAL
nr:retrovirus-related Pol polyprotein from transposon TNT 1-94 [Tanacetum cinerariifolium]